MWGGLYSHVLVARLKMSIPLWVQVATPSMGMHILSYVHAERGSGS